VNYQNVIIISGEVSEVRSELLSLGMSFELVNLKGSPSFLVVTNQLEQMISLAKKLKQDTITISDRQRTTFVVSTADKKPTKLGKLCRISKETAAEIKNSGGFFLVVTDNQVPYYYSVQ
jgi:hypothetical protein